MPVKKDGTGKRWVEMELVVPGTPEQVWQAIATGPGYSAWFASTKLEERVGGELVFDMGAYGVFKGEVTHWEPPTRFEYVEREWGEEAPPLATEITVTARSGGTCLVRMVHSLFASIDDWDDQLEGFEKGWPTFFQVLRRYLEHYAGMKAAITSVMVQLQQPQTKAWKTLVESLGLTGLDVGEEIMTPVPEYLAGTIERIEQDQHQRYVLLRLHQPSPGLVLVGTYAVGDSTNVTATVYFYGEDAAERAAASQPVWRSWCEATFQHEG